MKPYVWNWEIYKGLTFVKTFTLSKNRLPYPSGNVGIRQQIRTRSGDLYLELSSDSGEWLISTDTNKHTFVLTISAEDTSKLENVDNLVYSIEVYNDDGIVISPFIGRVLVIDEVTIEN